MKSQSGRENQRIESDREPYLEELTIGQTPEADQGQTDQTAGQEQEPVRWFRKPDNILIILTVLAVLLGIMTGLLVRLAKLTAREIQAISFPGVIMMNMLKMLIIPLVVSSLVSGISSLNTTSSRRIGIVTFAYYIMTTLLAVVLGIVLVLLIHPGNASMKKQTLEVKTGKLSRGTSTLHSILDLLRNLIPDNIIVACFRQTSTDIIKKNVTYILPNNSTGWKITEDFKITTSEQTNALGLLSVSIFLGIVLRRMGDKALLLTQLFNIMNDAVMMMIKVVIWYSPIGIYFLITGKLLETDNLSGVLKSLGLYMVTVTAGLVIHAVVTLPLAYLALTRKNPFTFFIGVFQAWITALGTASSAATLPITFKCLEENNKIDRRITRFVLPIGATINMDGTALYEAVACIFIAQVNDVKLNVGQIIVVSITATLAAMGAASVPSAGIVTMVLVLTSVGLPTDDISLILTVDWLLDRLRTSVNVLGDAFGAGVVDHMCRSQLDEGSTAAADSGRISARKIDTDAVQSSAEATLESDRPERQSQV